MQKRTIGCWWESNLGRAGGTAPRTPRPGGPSLVRGPPWTLQRFFFYLLDKVKNADIRESLNIEALLLRLERSQLRWYGHVTRMSQERTAKKLLCSTPIGRRFKGRPRTRWRDYVEDLSWSRLGIPTEHLSFVAEDRYAWRLQLELLPPRPPKDKRVQKIDWLMISIRVTMQH